MRDAELTRQKILEISADEIHKKGFVATSLSCILVRCEVSKGALYHHFKNKMELGYAVFEEIYTPMFLELWQPAVEVNDPIEGLCDFFTAMYTNSSCDEIVCGCPLNNLCQEMSGVDEGFRLRILNMQQQLNQLIAINLQRVANQLRDDIDFSQVAYFIVSTFHGSSSLSKSSKNKDLFEKVIKELCNYIRNLKSH
ncbi:TetR/AcrR family transcriptional regulator [Colwellia hornerae]|uniref:TetR/AcrR family transcriptional regulator n=1 Tax=Colwellia hornerae TaxID=89402 RepID=A0A5C6Q4X0_9GAMM|nr:TetR/AcrR family transcriptional regulator [Colwellia hornerae]TWX48084.1 TetR/AcrR family transcriptional regulator [Colwellia hornerae]TWX54903.1 TetR/AcrR family transcriptional regulator [Colwellia hornerae]TWX63761.1 TetR/AcrR family transcriptional regulator [Colwellia hornerae]